MASEDKDDVSLPKATVVKLIKEYMPNELRVASDTVEMLVECCTAFIQDLSGTANDMATKESKNTIQPEHVISALEEMGFTEFVGEVRAAYNQFKQDAKSQPKLGGRKTKAEEEGLSEAEQIALQQQLFAAARARSQNLDATNQAIVAAAYQAPAQPQQSKPEG